MADTRMNPRTLLPVLGLFLAACASGGNSAPDPEPTADVAPRTPEPARVAASTVHVGVHCGTRGAQPAVSWVGNIDARQRLTRRLEANALGGFSGLPRVDFERHGLVLVEMGRRATTGYSLELATPRVLVQPDGRARMEIRARTPQTGDVTAPMLTYPCLVARVPRAGFDRLSVVDDEGRSWGTARID